MKELSGAEVELSGATPRCSRASSMKGQDLFGIDTLTPEKQPYTGKDSREGRSACRCPSAQLPSGGTQNVEHHRGPDHERQNEEGLQSTSEQPERDTYQQLQARQTFVHKQHQAMCQVSRILSEEPPALKGYLVFRHSLAVASH